MHENSTEQFKHRFASGEEAGGAGNMRGEASALLVMFWEISNVYAYFPMFNLWMATLEYFLFYFLYLFVCFVYIY